ncbi:MAG: Lrp/AsnC family transcriptional regulator [Porphyromonas sp.]|nr:Lrp/AsnC family transcriptional regulator [Porphyromonas sp.]
MYELDKIDTTILNILSLDARTPFKDIAEICKLSRAAVHQRVQRMIAKGVIIGSGYHVDLIKIGYRTYAYVGVKLERASYYKRVSEELVKIPEVIECNFTTGLHSLFIKLYARDNNHLLDILNGKIQQIDGVVSTETMITLERIFHRPLLLPEDFEDEEE